MLAQESTVGDDSSFGISRIDGGYSGLGDEEALAKGFRRKGGSEPRSKCGFGLSVARKA
jgi:hypothetical protein